MKKLFLSIAAAVMSAASYGQFFTSTTYRGAFGVGAGSDWTTGWANFNPRNAVYPGTGEPGGLAGKTRVNVGGLPFVANNPDGLFHITTNTTWTSSNVYYLTGPVAVDAGVTLTINAGTYVRGTNAGGGVAYLVISRGGKLNANGTSTNPVVMTSDQIQGARNAGDWGGLMICGNAQTNLFNPAFHAAGLPGERNFEATSTVNATRYGRSAGPINNESSGNMTYLRVEFAGDAATLNAELNGIMLAGVGSGTVFNHVQVSYAKDDSFEWFGGTVDGKYLIAFGGVDDDFDMDEGFSGRLQFGFVLRDPRFYDAGTAGNNSNMFEIDNNTTQGSTSGTSSALGFSPTPATFPTISNFTCIGPLKSGQTAAAVAPRFGFGFNARTNPSAALFNSIVIGSAQPIIRSNSPAQSGHSTVNQPSNWTKFSCDSLILGKNGFIMDPVNTNALVNVGGFAGTTSDCSGAFASKTATDLQNFLTLAKYGNVISKTTTTDATNVGIAQPEYTLVSGVLQTSDGAAATFAGNADLNFTVVQPYLLGTSVYASGADFTNPRLGVTAAPNKTIVGTESVFGFFNNLVVPNGTTANLTGSINVTGGVTVQTGGTLNIGNNSITGTGSITFQSGANITTTNPDGFGNTSIGIVKNTGARSLSTLANYTFNGTAAQVTGAFWSGGKTVTINNAAGVSLTTAATVNGALNLTAGTLTAGSFLTMGSSATSQGVINNMTPTFNGTLSASSIKYRRYTNGGYLQSRAISNPLTGTNSINTAFVPFGVSCNAVKRFNQFTNAWTPVDFIGTGCTDNLPLGEGRLVPASGVATFEFTGTPNFGSQTFNLTRSAGTVPPAPFVARGWNSLGNPYPNAIDWSLVDNIAGNLTNSPLNAYVWNTAIGNYGTILPSGVATNANNLIAPAQNFLIRKATVGTIPGGFTLDNTVRVASENQTFIRRATNIDTDIRLAIKGNEVGDEVVLFSGADATDVEKAFSPLESSVSLFIPSAEEGLVFKKLDGSEKIVPVSVIIPENGSYTLSTSALKGLSEDSYLVIEDKATNKFIPVGEDFTYTFNASKGSSARFALHFQKGDAPKAADKSASALIYSNNQNLTILLNNVSTDSKSVATLSDLSGRILGTYNVEGTEFKKSLNVAPGIYTVVVKGNGFSKTQKVVISSN